MRKITFIHAADLHLGGVFSGFQHMPEAVYKDLKESGYAALKKLIDTAIARKVDFVLFAGDIYDLDNRNLKAQLRFKSEMERLHQEQIDVYLIHGNHDYIDGEYYNLSLPPNVHIFGRHLEMKSYQKKDGTKVNLYGFSYGSRHVRERMIQEYQKQGNADYHIGLLHGNLDGESAHGNYAPFSKSDLLNKQFDYWALGHIHKRMILTEDPPAIYPGCLQGRHKKETGEKGFYLVTMEGMKTDLEFIPVSEIEWRTEIVFLEDDGCTNVEALVEKVKNIQDQLRTQGKKILLELVVNASKLKSFDDFSIVSLDEVIESLQEGEEEEDEFVWIHSAKWIPPMQIEESENISGSFIKELLRKTQQISIEEIHQWGEAMLTHTAARRYLNPLDEEVTNEISDGAALELLKFLEK